MTMALDSRKLFYASLFFIITIIAFGYYRFIQEKENINQAMNESLFHSVKIAHVLIGNNYHERVLQQAPTPQEERTTTLELSQLAKAEEVEYIYSMVLDENNTLRFTSSSATDEELKTGKNLTHFYDEYEENPNILDALNNKKIVYDMEGVEDQWGKSRSIFIGHTDSYGHRYIIGADIRVDSIESLSQMAALKALLGSIVILFGALPLMFLYRYIVRKNSLLLAQQVQIATKDLQEARDNALLAMEHANQANRAKDNFLSSMSHELRTPLNAIIGFSQILLHRTELSDSVKSTIDKIHISGKNLLTLVNTLLDLSKIEAGKMEMQMIEFSVAHLLSEITILVESMAHKKGVSLELLIDEKLTLMADRQLIKQVMINLITNGIKFSIEGSSIILEYRGEPSRHIFWIRDHGIGIASDQIERLFDPFVQIREDQNESIKGTGLGLAIVKKIIEMHGGEIWVESVVGEGSCFYFSLPT